MRDERKQTWKVKRRSSIWTSLVRKSAPMVALYWFISEVLPTLSQESQTQEEQRRGIRERKRGKWGERLTKSRRGRLIAAPAVAEDDDLEEHSPVHRHGRSRRIWGRRGSDRTGPREGDSDEERGEAGRGSASPLTDHTPTATATSLLCLTARASRRTGLDVASTAGGSFDAAAFEAERLRLDAAARDGMATTAAAAEAEADLLDHASWI
jgi:hypothetical protein